MVNFNPGEFRGFHGRWMLGGERHAHIRRRKGLLGAVEHAAGAGIERDSRKVERDAIRAQRTANVEIRRTAEATARSRGISSSMMRDAERQAGIGRGAEMAAAEKGTKEERKTTRRATRGRRVLGRRGYHRGLYGHRGPGAGILRAAALARLFRGSKKTAPKTSVHVPGVPTAKKAPAKKKAAKKKATAKPRTVKPPKAPTGKRTTGARGKGAGQKVTPSSQVMANLAGYVNAPGGKRAGIGVAGRTSASSTGRTAGSRVGASSSRGSLVVGGRRH